MSGTGLVLVLTSNKAFSDPAFIEKLRVKGIDKFIVFEVPE